MARVRYSFSSRKTGHLENIDKQKEKFPDLLKKVIQISDIILQVLDARFVEEMLNEEILDQLKGTKKKLIYVINKSDLVDIKKVKKSEILKHLKDYVFVSAKSGKGVTELRNKIKILSNQIRGEQKKKDNQDESFKQRIQVGIVGYPNAGKSSLINLLTRKGSTKVSSTSGYTKGLQKVKLIKDVLIIDSPGVIPTYEYTTTKKGHFSEHAKVNARSYDQVKDPQEIIEYLFEKHAEDLNSYYNTNAINSNELMDYVGKEKKLLKKGGKINEDRTARFILKDWQEGKITKKK